MFNLIAIEMMPKQVFSMLSIKGTFTHNMSPILQAYRALAYRALAYRVGGLVYVVNR